VLAIIISPVSEDRLLKVCYEGGAKASKPPKVALELSVEFELESTTTPCRTTVSDDTVGIDTNLAGCCRMYDTMRYKNCASCQ
jgi:hypothetical protein